MKIVVPSSRVRIVVRPTWFRAGVTYCRTGIRLTTGRRPVSIATASLLPLVLAVTPTAAHAERLSVGGFIDIATRCGASVAPATLAAVAKTESNFRTLIVSDNNSRRAREFASIDEAAAVADGLIALGHSIDLGLMQINSANLRRLGYTTRDALDPCKSVSGGAMILSRNYAGIRNVSDPQIALRHALSQYNTGSIRAGYRNGYVRRVEEAARALLSAVRGSSALSTTTTAIARAADPATRRIIAVSWNVWADVGHSVTPRGISRMENVLVF